jgi:hypothetical protein
MDQNIKCKDCGIEFVFTEAEQNFFEKLVQSGKITNFVAPKRCKKCREANKRQKEERGY